MKTLSAALLAHYAQSTTTICTIWKITRLDGEVFGFTDLDRDVSFDGMTYSARSGYTPSQLESKVDLSVDNMELIGLLDSAGITANDVEAGLWNGAAYEISEINYLDESMGRNLLSTGWIGQIRRGKQGLQVAELRGLASKLQMNVGRIVLPTCDAQLGDARCGVDLGPFTLVGIPVTTVESRLVIVATDLTTASSPPFAAGWFNWGVITFTTGANAGLAQDIKEYEADGTLTLQMAFPYTVAVGDEFTIRPGCNKLLKTGEDEYLGDCKVKFDNVVNFQGFAEVPLPSESVAFPG